MKDNCVIAIMSCDNFSDLWEGHVRCLNQHWPNRNFNTFIVSESKKMNFENVSVFNHDDKNWTERLKFFLLNNKSDYVFLTLDDYYLMSDFSDLRLNILLNIMKNNDLDYLRLFKRPTKATLKNIKLYEDVYMIDSTQVYSLNLYTGIWKRDFLLSIIDGPMNPWQFEVYLTSSKRKIKCRGAVDLKKDDFKILDVVRKGKLLRKAKRFFLKYPNVYTGERKANTFWYELKLGIVTISARIIPLKLRMRIKKILRKMGMKFYSED